MCAESFTQAITVIRQAIIPQGIMASAHATDNYNRVWSRDAVMTGIAGAIAGDEEIIQAFRNTICTLVENQSEVGQIPSNVAFDTHGNVTHVSYGSLVGRTDATIWWIIGACVCIHCTTDDALKQTLHQPIAKTFALLKAWEFNNRGLIYVPLGGNWADEYVTQGYVLYDQLLRLWALEAAAKIYHSKEYDEQAKTLRQIIKYNYKFHQHTDIPVYHPSAFAKAQTVPFWWCSFSPSGYDTRWDMAANAFALLLDIGKKEDYQAVDSYLYFLNEVFSHWLLPAFYPVIKPESEDWRLLEDNYSYRFKNEPYHFHNSGAWIIFLGWLALGLKRQHFDTTISHIAKDVTQALQSEKPSYSFYEYWNPQSRQPGGVAKLCFSASGTIFLLKATQETSFHRIKDILLI
ncbi:MAG: hypothetical protein KA974_07985 [Saprospiraceae bacterium]|nr:hypothetical protein [Saprospiraceae bacterium]MBP7699005.1 hypothetical protein [Saprospiraceae bacterium]